MKPSGAIEGLPHPPDTHSSLDHLPSLVSRGLSVDECACSPSFAKFKGSTVLSLEPLPSGVLWYGIWLGCLEEARGSGRC